MYPNNLFPEVISSSRLIWLKGSQKEKDMRVKELTVKHIKIRVKKQ